MASSAKKVFFADHTFHIAENVYEPADDSIFFAENLCVRKGDFVLDMGTGCGILGILAAIKDAHVVAIDINPFAVRCAKENGALNHITAKLSVVQGDLFAPISPVEWFDAVLFNAPYLPAEDCNGDSWLEKAWVGGPFGRKVIDRFIAEVPRYLKPEGRVFLMQSTLSGVEETLQRFRANGLEVRIAAKRHLPLFESLVLVVARY